MTIDDAIKILLEEADKHDKLYQMAKRFECQEFYRNMMQFYMDNAFNYKQMAEWLTEYKEAKILLKSAIENAQSVDVNGDVRYDWAEAYEALKLIGDKDNEH